MRVRYWGTRGSLPSPSVEEDKFYTSIHGGNTSCVEVAVPAGRIIIDAGSGIARLGNRLTKEYADDQRTRELNLLLSHTHWDHIQGFPFFKPAYNPLNTINIYAQEKDVVEMRRVIPTTEQALEHQQKPPYFPVPLKAMRGDLNFKDVKPGDVFEVGGVIVRTAALNHPDGYIGFRLEHGGRVATYTSDNEPNGKESRDNLLELAHKADLLIQDAQYTPEEYETRKGWGHSTYQQAVDIAIEAGVKRLRLFHHDPEHDDRTMVGIAQKARDYADEKLRGLRRSLTSLQIEAAREGIVEDI